MNKYVLAAIFLAAAVVAVYLGMTSYLSHNEGHHEHAEQPVSRDFFKPTMEIETAYTLTSHTGDVVNSSDFEGKYQLIYFGFTNCPDVCPVDLAAMSVALDEMPEDALSKIQPVFITIDPSRDTPEAMAEYVDSFHPSLIGLTGTAEEVNTVAKGYKAFHSHNHDHSGEVEVNHSAFTYLVGPDGELVGMFSHPLNPEVVVQVLKAELNASATENGSHSYGETEDGHSHEGHTHE